MGMATASSRRPPSLTCAAGSGTLESMLPAPRPDRPDEPLYCKSFTEFVERVALPRLLENPSALRLDGEVTGGNREVAGRFFFGGRQWKVHSDTHFEPLLLAYWHARRFGETSTFERASTGSSERLALVPQLRRIRASPHQHLYIYGE